MKIGDYVVKSVIFETRYLPDFEMENKAPVILNEIAGDFNRFDVTEVTKQRGYVLTNEELYLRLGWDWNRFYLLVQNCESIEDARNKLTKYLGIFDEKYGKNIHIRIGTRVIFLFPLDITIEEISNYFNEKIYKSKKMFEKVGKIKDIGFAGFTMEEDNYKIHFSFGPMTKDEVSIKLSEFYYNDAYSNVIMVDLDLFKENIKINAKQYFEQAVDAARIKCLKIKEELENE